MAACNPVFPHILRHHELAVALVFEQRTWSYAELDDWAARAAGVAWHRWGVRSGDRVAWLGGNHPGLLALLFGLARIGATLLPLNFRLAAAEWDQQLADCTPRQLVHDATWSEAARSLAARAGIPARGLEALDEEAPPAPDHSAPGAAALLVYTSGTTGGPKAAVHTQANLLANMALAAQAQQLGPADTVLTVLPLFHVGGLNIQTTPALQLGATVTIHARFAPDTALATIAHDRPTLTVMVPAIIQAVSEHPAWTTTDLSSLKALATGSTIVPPHLIDRFVARGVPVLQVYGSTETCPIAIYTRLGGDLSREGSTGLAGLCCEAQVIDQTGREVPAGTPGEIAVRGPNVFFEYWSNADATHDALQDGWYRTGDIGLCDADGYFWVRDRKKNLIISGGENVYPAEVERVLLEHPDVSECAVIGRPDSRWDEVPIAYVIPRSGCRLEADELRAHLQAQLARYKVPRDIVFVTDLPRTALGKVQHFLLKQLDAQSRARGEAS